LGAPFYGADSSRTRGSPILGRDLNASVCTEQGDSGRLGARIRLAGLLALGMLAAACGSGDVVAGRAEIVEPTSTTSGDVVAESAAIVEPTPTTSVDAPASLREQLTDSDWRLIAVTGFSAPDVFDFTGPGRPTFGFGDVEGINFVFGFDSCNRMSMPVEWSADSYRPYQTAGPVGGSYNDEGCEDTNRLFQMFSPKLVASVIVVVDGDTITLTRGNRTVTAERYERPEPVPPESSPQPPETTEAPSS